MLWDTQDDCGSSSVRMREARCRGEWGVDGPEGEVLVLIAVEVYRAVLIAVIRVVANQGVGSRHWSTACSI